MKTTRETLALAFMAGYIALMLYETVFGRVKTAEIKYNFLPFWSYIATYKGEGYDLIRGSCLNILMFIPLGISLWFVQKNKEWKRTLAICCIVSISIEVLQLILRRGFCEFDDVIHNSIGGLVGYFVCSLVATLQFRRKRNNDC